MRNPYVDAPVGIYGFRDPLNVALEALERRRGNSRASAAAARQNTVQSFIIWIKIARRPSPDGIWILFVDAAI